MSCKRNNHQIFQYDFRKLCLINLSASEENQQEKKSENVQKSTDNQKTAQQKHCDNNQYKEDKEAAEAE